MNQYVYDATQQKWFVNQWERRMSELEKMRLAGKFGPTKPSSTTITYSATMATSRMMRRRKIVLSGSASGIRGRSICAQ